MGKFGLFVLHLSAAAATAMLMNIVFPVPPHWWIWFPCAVGAMLVYRRALRILELERGGQPVVAVESETWRGEPVKVSEAAMLVWLVRGVCVMFVIGAVLLTLLKNP